MGISLTVYNGRTLIGQYMCSPICIFAAPVELLSLYIDAPWLLVLNDFRQGVLIASLFSFWIILVGEHKRTPQEVSKLFSRVGLWLKMFRRRITLDILATIGKRWEWYRWVVFFFLCMSSVKGKYVNYRSRWFDLHFIAEVFRLHSHSTVCGGLL